MTDVIDPVEVMADAISAANNDAPCADIPPDLARHRRKEARAALTAAEAAGMVLVPVAPTHAMEVAAFHVFEIDNPKQYINGTAARNAVYGQ